MIKLKSLLIESRYYDPEEDTSENLPSVNLITQDILLKIVAAAQAQYDGWMQDEDGTDAEVGSGGICHLIADDLAGIISDIGIECETVSSNFEQHVYLVCKFKEGVYEIDIPYSVYETGGGYNWKKIPNVKFDGSHVAINKLDNNPNDFKQYTNEDI